MITHLINVSNHPLVSKGRWHFHDLRAYCGGHGMPAGDTVGEQIILWSYLNINPHVLYHHDHGVCGLVWFRTYSDNGEPAFSLTPKGTIRIVNQNGETVPHTLPNEGWFATFNGEWEITTGTAEEMLARMDEYRRGDVRLDAARRAANAVLGNKPGSGWAFNCYINEQEGTILEALREYIKLNA